MRELAEYAGAAAFGALGIWAELTGIGGFWFWVVMVLILI